MSPSPLRLLGHLELQDLEALDPDKAPLDAYSVSQSIPSMDHPKLATIRKRGIRLLRYINVLTLPLPEWVGGSPWFRFIDSYEPAGPLKTSAGREARFPWFGNPTLWTWNSLKNAKRDQIRKVLNELVPAEDGLFLDLAYREPPFWAFGPQGAPYTDFPETLWLLWHRNIISAISELRTIDKRLVLLNGDNSMPMPCFFERCDWNLEATWDEHIALWRAHPENVLSVYAGARDAVQNAIDAWTKRGEGWLAFTGDQPDLGIAYAQALSARGTAMKQGESIHVSGLIGRSAISTAKE